MGSARSSDLERRLLRAVGDAIGEFKLIGPGDRILVALSGGKDSFALLHLLLALQRRAPVRFELEVTNLDPGYAGYRRQVIIDHVAQLRLPMHPIAAPIQQLVDEKLRPGQAACPLCSRMRRGALYTLAQKLGCNKLALGHHLDDALETLLLNLFYAGALRAMPPLLVRAAPGPSVIRPLCFVHERDLQAYAAEQRFPVIPCASAHCADADRRRQVIKRLLGSLEAEHPQLKNQMRRALGNVDPRFLFVPGGELAGLGALPALDDE